MGLLGRELLGDGIIIVMGWIANFLVLLQVFQQGFGGVAVSLRDPVVIVITIEFLFIIAVAPARKSHPYPMEGIWYETGQV